jgi:predicted dehydrogenase
MIRIGIIGTGGMAHSHAVRFGKIRGCRVTACCDIVFSRAEEFARKHGIPAVYNDAEKMFSEEQLDCVSIVTSDRAHAPVAIAAAHYGIHIMCEKPLATSFPEAMRMVKAAQKRKLITAVNFSYRNSPATQKAAQLVKEGVLGRILHVEGSYLQSWLVSKIWGDWKTKPSLLWRLSTRHGSAGTLGDIGVHLYDLASFVVGDFAEISCTLKTFDKGTRQIGEYILDANDSMIATVKFSCGAIGTLHASRWATGHTNSISLRVFGDKGGLDLNLDRPAPETLRICAGRDKDKSTWRPVRCPAVPDMYQRFINALRTGTKCQANFETGAKVQAYLDASFESEKKGGFIKIKLREVLNGKNSECSCVE